MAYDFEKMLSDARIQATRPESDALRDLIGQGVELETLFQEFASAAEDHGIDVSVGTCDELRALLQADSYAAQGSLAPFGPSLQLSWHGRRRTFCMGVDGDADKEGGDDTKTRLLTWSGVWPDCTFEDDLGVASVEEFFEALAAEVASIQQDAQVLSRIKQQQRATSPEVSTLWTDRVSNGLFVLAIFFALASTCPHIHTEKLAVPALFVAGLLKMIAGFRKLIWASEVAEAGGVPKWGKGVRRIFFGALLVAAPTFVAMLEGGPGISPAFDLQMQDPQNRF